MTKSRDPLSCWPTPEHSLLLRAALLEGPAGLEAWRQWRAQVDLQTVDSGSQRLICLLYRNLQAQSVADPVLQRYKGYYRRTWYDNQLKLDWLAGLLPLLAAAGVQTLVLKGAPLALQYYPTLGLRPMEDVDVLVHPADARAALAVLMRDGWRPDHPDLERRLGVQAELDLTGPDGQRLDLHWHVLTRRICDADDEPFWAAAAPLRLGAVETLTLNATDLLVHVCVHGAAWDPVPSVRWAADALMILRTAGGAFDWERLLAHARRLRLSLPLHDTLDYLKRTLDAPVPDEALSALARIAVTRAERFEYATLVRYNPLVGLLPIYWFTYARTRDGASPLGQALGFPAFLARLFGAAGSRELLAIVARRARERLSDSLKRRVAHTQAA